MAARRRRRPTITYRSPTIRARTLEFLVDYTPRALPLDDWLVVREFAIDSVANVQVRDGDHAKNLALLTARLALWATSLGYDLEPETVFHPAMVERYVQGAYPKESDGQSDLRARLRRVAECSTRQAPWPGRPPAYPRRISKAPYLAGDLALLEADALVQKTETRQRTFETVLANGRGWAAMAADLRTVRGTDFFDTSEGLVVATNGREVPVLSEFRERVAALAERAGGDFMLPGKVGASKVGNKIDKLTYGSETPKLVLTRLRATWVRDHLIGGIPPTELRRALGLTTYSFLRDIYPTIPLLPDSEYRSMLSEGRQMP